MMKTCLKLVYIAAIGTTVLFAACSQPPAPPAKVVPVKPDTSSALTNIRNAGNGFDSSVEVHPLRDPSVDGLQAQARQLEGQQKPAEALDKVAAALKIAPNAPDLLQYQAELYVETNQWKAAADAAQRSYDLGPKVGALCAKNLQTVVEAGNALSDGALMARAKEKISGCKVPAPNRF